MKTNFFAVCLLFALAGCDVGGIRGNGHLITEQRKVEPFINVDASGAFRIDWHSGPPTASVTIDENLMQYVEMEVRDRILYIRTTHHVPLGFSFQIFCLTLAFYAAITVYGVQANWYNHVGAAVVLLSPVVVVPFVNHYLWDFYFEKKRQTPIPHFLREVFALIVFLIALLIVLSVGYHASAQLRGMVVGSGVAAIILGLAGQNLLSGIIAGVSLQMNRPYKVGDWLRVGEIFGEVREINWRSTRLCTNDDIYLDIPNSEIVKTTIVNLHYPTEAHAMRIRVGVDYNVAPNRVKDALIRAAQSAKNVLVEPAVRVFLVDFADHAVIYEIKYYMVTAASAKPTCAIRDDSPLPISSFDRASPSANATCFFASCSASANCA